MFREDDFPLKQHTNLHFEKTVSLQTDMQIYILSRPVLCEPTRKPIHLPSQGTTQHRCLCCRAQCGSFSWAPRSLSLHGTCRCCHGWTWFCCCSSGGFCVSCPFCQTRWRRRWRWSRLPLHPQSPSQFRTLKNRIVKWLRILTETLISLKQNKSRRRREIRQWQSDCLCASIRKQDPNAQRGSKERYLLGQNTTREFPNSVFLNLLRVWIFSNQKQAGEYVSK